MHNKEARNEDKKEQRNSKLTFEDQRSVRSDEHGARAGTTYGTSPTLRINRNVTGKDDGITTVPGRALNPVNRVEERCGRAVAGVFGVNAFNVVVTRGSEEVHEDGLDGLGLVNDSLRTDIEASDGAGVDVVLLE